jgi:hypothetical protein
VLEVFLKGIYKKRYLPVDFVAKEDGLLRNSTWTPDFIIQKDWGVCL